MLRVDKWGRGGGTHLHHKKAIIGMFCPCFYLNKYCIEIKWCRQQRWSGWSVYILLLLSNGPSVGAWKRASLCDVSHNISVKGRLKRQK